MTPRRKPTTMIAMPDIRVELLNCTQGERRIGAKTRVVAVGGKVIRSSGVASRHRWNNLTATMAAARSKRQVAGQQRHIKIVTAELQASKDALVSFKRDFTRHAKMRDKSGRNTLRLNELREWARDHMPSLLEMAVDGNLARFRFCAAAMRGAGSLVDSPNRYVIPAMWITISIDTGRILHIESDGPGDVALHPHASEDAGEACLGDAVIQRTGREAPNADVVKIILTGMEKWRLCYGDDCFQPVRGVARETWNLVANGGIGLAPIQGTSGLVYKDLNAMLAAEPWDGSKRKEWCTGCDTPYINCKCCPTCGNTDGNCTCDECETCGPASGCDCCAFCEGGTPGWSYRGSGNEHQVCIDCGYCRLHEAPEAAYPPAGRVVWFLVEQDVRRVIELDRLDHEAGRRGRPVDYSETCTCDNCRQYTDYLRRHRQ